MISVLSTTGKYILQPSLMDMHRNSLEWLSASMLWKQELSFFKKLLSEYAYNLTDLDDKKKVDHFDNLIIYYDGELVDLLRKKLREHEGHLASMLQQENESDTQYYKEHEGLMKELKSFDSSFNELKHDFYRFIDKRMG